jgi:hypothetical protein
LCRLALLLAVLLAGGWAALALWLSPLAPHTARPWLALAAGLLSILTLVAIALGRHARPALVAQAILFTGVLAAFLTLQPRNDRAWQDDVARMPMGELDGDLLTVRNVRNFDWAGPDTAEPRWEDRTYDLGEIEGVDLVASYWMGPHIAHIMLSFRFANALPLIVSIEIRRERGEVFSALGGFFRNFELVYVAADERDLIGVRTAHRGEDVYLFPLNVPPQGARLLLLEYVAEMNGLALEPVWYNTLLTNCTTQIRVHANAAGGAVPWSWRILLSGHTPEFVYRRGGIATDLPFAALRRRARVNDAANAAAGQPDFSERIRAGPALRSQG